MNITIVCVGKLKEAWQKQGVEEYLKRLSRYGKYEIIQVEDVRDPDKPSEALMRQGMEKEGEAILNKLRATDYVIALCVKAAAPDSPALAERLNSKMGTMRRVVLLIGGSNGLSDAVLRRADERISFSNLTFPHGLMRVVLLEQLYRAERILAGERYHK